MLDAADIEAIAQRTAELVRTSASAPASILTRREARQYVRRTSDAAFSAWAARWQVRAECRGRWSRARLDLALAREAGTAHVPANLRK